MHDRKICYRDLKVKKHKLKYILTMIKLVKLMLHNVVEFKSLTGILQGQTSDVVGIIFSQRTNVIKNFLCFQVLLIHRIQRKFCLT